MKNKLKLMRHWFCVLFILQYIDHSFSSNYSRCDTYIDNCGVCGGNGNTCRRVEGVFDLDKLRVGYNDILLIPTGATNIRIEERFATNNYLSVRNINGQYYLNGNWRIQFPRNYTFAGTTFSYYSRRKPFGILSPESLRANGPTTEPLIIVLLFREKNKGLVFEYTVPTDSQIPGQHSLYTWISTDFSQCSKTCGSGIQTRSVNCVRVMDHLPVTDSLCDLSGRPIDNQICNAQPCANWFTSDWTQCLCHYGIQHRLVYCHSSSEEQSGKILADNECLQLNQTKPTSLQKCKLEKDCAVWTTGDWQKCNSNCGPGTQVREVNCTLMDQIVNESDCEFNVRPIDTQECNDISCDGVDWMTSEWSSCDEHCGPNMQTRKVVCSDQFGTIFPSEACDVSRMPQTSRLCSEEPECTSIWYTSEWSYCSTKCGNGVQTRHVFCGHTNENSEIIKDEDSQCISDKPQNVSVCHQTNCTGSWMSAQFDMCTVPCSGGQKSRKVICLNLTNNVVSDEDCGSDLKPIIKEDCNTNECNEDILIAVTDCKNSKYGCCPDGITPSEQLYSNCSPIDITNGCNSTEFGCCKDLETAAFGPFQKGCPIRCNFTRFGCCPDGITVANSSTLDECPQPTQETTIVTTPETTTTEVVITTTMISEEFENLSLTKSDCIGEGSGDSPDISCGESTEKDVDTQSEKSSDGGCKTSTYGCCPDGVTAASGSDGDGCIEGSGDVGEVDCKDESCIPEITTEIIDCNATEFGCCPNGKKAATGPRYYGCTCQDFANGCCQDKYTPAEGPNYEGCVCSRMLYGCCNDGVTPAIGPNSEGCSCEASTYGCCPDMVSQAKGSNYVGCPCDSLTYGCCPGSITPATGPNFEGCSCANTPFGCCHDGITIAYGPKFEGCPSGPSLDLKLASEVCGLNKERGSCRNYTVKWYFDVTYGGCNRFWYGGCEGNGNRFSSQEQCELSCVKPEGPEKCALPKVSGPCNGSYVMWHFTTESRSCQQFIYGGCLGNTNKYDTKEVCEQSCVHQETVLDRCDQSPSVGPCRGNYERWYYRKEEGRCLPFNYGGCKGNQNNFQSEEECRNSCGSQTAQEICAFPKAEGPCLGSFPRWYYDNDFGICREFIYSGCEGNKNRFVDKGNCERMCNQTKVMARAESVCSLPREEGPCRAAIIQWYFNQETRRCERFYYGGCEGNGNRFDDRASCERSCLFAHWDRNICHQPKEPGNCFDYRERWYYDQKDRKCHRFYYSGCKGNENNFNSFEDCSQKCGPFSVVSTELSVKHFKTEYCFKSYESGPCLQNEIRWFYDRTDGVCKEFLYGGCEGNENRFTSRSDCEAKCWNSQNICKLEKVVGSCSGRFTQWYFDSNSNECLEFLFSGCHGNANRFNSKEMCDAQCKSHTSSASVGTVSTVHNICDQSHIAGPCRGYFPRWFYSREDNQCRQFIYGGCEGNDNRFDSSEECERKCLTKISKPWEGPDDYESREVVCRQEVESGPCTETQALWFYDPQSHTCLPFVYGGCNGNKNRFKTYEFCMRFCSGISPLHSVPPQIPTERRPVTEIPYECSVVECEEQRCPFGIDDYIDERGCKACRCSNPCYVYQCPEHMSCAVEVYRDEKGEPRAQPVCRLKNKPGVCPSDLSSNSLTSECIDRCRTDADCRKADKCCNNGCAMVCVLPENISNVSKNIYTYEPHHPKSGDTNDNEFVVIAGSNVTLNCEVSVQSNQVRLGWSKDGQPFYLVTDRIQLLPNGSLWITNVDKEDAGNYACAVDSGTTLHSRLIIHEPARILPGPQIVIAQLNLPSYLQCNAIGNPDPRVTWWKGQQMLPLNSIQYRQFSNFTLLIRRIDDKDGGVYTCQAYNGLGPIALWDVILLLDSDSTEPDIRPYDASAFNSTNIRDNTNYSINGNIHPIDPNLKPIITNQMPERLSADIRTLSSGYTIGSTLELECVVNGMHTTIDWFFNNDIPIVSDNRHYRILPNNTLIVYNLSSNDSGEYRCRASNQYTQVIAMSKIRVESQHIPTDCEDSPFFANCDLIVKAKYCNNPHYAKFCCHSCLIAAQVDNKW